jgi:hypothetical protein
MSFHFAAAVTSGRQDGTSRISEKIKAATLESGLKDHKLKIELKNQTK